MNRRTSSPAASVASSSPRLVASEYASPAATPAATPPSEAADDVAGIPAVPYGESKLTDDEKLGFAAPKRAPKSIPAMPYGGLGSVLDVDDGFFDDDFEAFTGECVEDLFA